MLSSEGSASGNNITIDTHVILFWSGIGEVIDLVADKLGSYRFELEH